MSRLFGTDGIRGVANLDLTPELAFRVGRAGARVLAHSSGRHRPVVVGRDTRLSGTMLEAAIVAGITSAGRDVVAIGIVPTPGVACVTVGEGAAAGVMISASHNPIEDNGIKFFGSDGFKLPDAVEDEIEALLDSPETRPTGVEIGVARIGQNLVRHYYRMLESTGADLTGVRVVVDAAYGAAYAIAPYVLRKMGATVDEINCENDGARINVDCGATDLSPLLAALRKLHAAGVRAVGVAFDGDADRALFVDETGSIVTGDHVLYALGRKLYNESALPGNALVGTVMTNIGAERALEAAGIRLVRTPVGDRYVLEAMRREGLVLGGEQSGHVIDLRHNTTGDGPMTAVLLLAAAAKAGATLHELTRDVVVAPQVLLNVRTRRRELLEAEPVREAIASAQAALDGSGRILVRASGTEPLIRVMAEGDDAELIQGLAGRVVAALQKEIERLGET